MEVIHKRRSGTELSQLIQNGKPAGQAGRDKRTEVSPPILSAKVTISKKAREPQRITEPLARKGDGLLAADRPVEPAGGHREAGAGRRQGLEAHRLEQPRRAEVPRIGEEQRPLAAVQREESLGALGLGAHRRRI